MSSCRSWDGWHWGRPSSLLNSKPPQVLDSANLSWSQLAVSAVIISHSTGENREASMEVQIVCIIAIISKRKGLLLEVLSWQQNLISIRSLSVASAQSVLWVLHMVKWLAVHKNRISWASGCRKGQVWGFVDSLCKVRVSLVNIEGVSRPLTLHLLVIKIFLVSVAMPLGTKYSGSRTKRAKHVHYALANFRSSRESITVASVACK
jgi:hypothetical protein